MPGCASVNCKNRADRGFRLFVFPADNKRKSVWLQNMRRSNWKPSPNARLCEVHFEESQFEAKRADSWKKLKPNAVPTLFNVPNPPPRIDTPPRRSIYKIKSNSASTNMPVVNAKSSQSTPEQEPKSRNSVSINVPLIKTVPSETTIEQDSFFINNMDDVDSVSTTLHEEIDNRLLKEKYDQLLKENVRLRKQLEEARAISYNTLQQKNKELCIKKEKLESFLNEDQMKMLEDGRLRHWSNESIVKGLKFRFALSIHGFDFLRSSGYPLPAYSTIMKKIKDIKLDFGIFDDVLELLRFKVETMNKTDKFCVLSYDEMCINEQLDYDKNVGKFSGYTTLGSEKNLLGQKLFLVVVRGVKNNWKQVIACHVTHKEKVDPNELKQFILDCISRVEECGLCVLLLSSDLDGRNRSLWTSMGISATRHGKRVNSFNLNEHEVYVSPDVCHLLKNLKSAVLRQIIYLPNEFVETEKLPTNIVDGKYIVKLWNYEVNNVGAKRLLHHLKIEDIEPSNFDKMRVGAAVRFFSSKTSSALKTAFEMKILPVEALTTAEFILIIEKWFTIVASKMRKVSITSRNCDQKYIFLHSVIDVFQNIVFQEGWKPLNYGFVLATLSFCDIAEYLFANGYDFLLGNRFTQDGTENIFSQIRKKEGKMPSALKAIRAIKGISVAQFVSDCKKTSYMNDSDEFLLDFCAKKRKLNSESVPGENNSIEPPPKKLYESDTHFSVQTFSIDDFSERIPRYDANSIYYIAGSTTNSIIKHVCDDCVKFLTSSNLPNVDFIKKSKNYTKGVNKGGLKEPCKQTFNLILHCEHYFNLYQDVIIRNGNCDIIKVLLENIKIDFLECCNAKYKIIKHFFNVRSYCLKIFYENCKQKKAVYGSATKK